MDINIRKSVIDNFKNSTVNDLRETINEATASSEEKILPGLGVFFEVLWKNSSNEFKNETLNILTNGIKK
jgi:small acid-soluble spore protein I (minor)